ncbi:scavenger receptor class B member 1-like [Plodia interpunctella]|uniref:scavenger receptor class B member 1-like n=1 Tax=Plodia interpunctella TaxID=58824 RepID=UPI002368E25F|nr:scavenger receptor class B member 1-like [Plodia interpunctella]
MVVGTKMTLQQVPSKGKISIIKIQNLAVHKRNSVIRVLYGVFMILVSILMISTNPLEYFTRKFLEVTEGSFVFRMWESPTYQLYSEVWVYNYTNVAQFLSGVDKTLKLEEIGPFRFQETRTNHNMSIDTKNGTMFMRPNITLKFLREESVADIRDVHVYVPNLALLAISTLVADKLGYFANAGAYHSINMLGSKLFRNLTVEELFWGYDDPMVTIASGLLPGWIDFKKIGVLDRFYAQRDATAVVEIRNSSSRFSLHSWDNSEGLVEQGFTDLNTSTLCNRIKGSYEGLMLPPNIPKHRIIPIFRRQACRVYPFAFKEETNEKYGFNYYRFAMEQSAMSNTSAYACKCTVNCLPNGFVDVSKCYYGFPIALSKPHFLDTDPHQQSFYEGMHPDPKLHSSILELEPTIGVPVSLSSKIQVNVAVRTSVGNPITRPFKDKMVPLLWLSLYCNEPPPEVVNLLKLRFLVAPPLFIAIEVLLSIVGLILSVQGCYRILKPKYELIETNPEKDNPERKKSTALVNMVDNSAFKDNDDLAKEAVLLLSVVDDDSELVFRRNT